jgi:ligand-binding sensor domain-containing protein
MDVHVRATRVAFAIGFALLASMAIRLPAADLRNVLTDYTITSWSQREGLPAGNVWALAQDHDGYLWVGSDGGLMRFDGVRFTPWQVVGEKQHDKPVRALHVSRDGSVWVGYGDTGGIARIRADRTRIYRESEGVAGAAIMVIVEDAAGTIWAGGEKGLLSFADEQWQRSGSWEGLPEAAVYSAFVDRSGRFYVGTATGIFRRSAGERRFSQVEVIDADTEQPTEAGLVGRFRRSLTEDASGRVPATRP